MASQYFKSDTTSGSTSKQINLSTKTKNTSKVNHIGSAIIKGRTKSASISMVQIYEPYIEMHSGYSTVIDSAGETKKIRIQSEYPWKFTCQAAASNFMRITNEDGVKRMWPDTEYRAGSYILNVTVAANTEGYAREFEFGLEYIYNSQTLTASTSITLTQESSSYANVQVSVSDDTVNYNSQYSEGNEIALNSDGLWFASTDADWVHLDNASGNGDATVTYTVDNNNGLSMRTATIVITDIFGNILSTIEVKQGFSRFENGISTEVFEAETAPLNDE